LQTVFGTATVPLFIQYYPFLVLGIDFLSTYSINPTLIGMIAGHLVFYFFFVLPVLINRPILFKLCGEEEIVEHVNETDTSIF
jgi:hypothetical protein